MTCRERCRCEGLGTQSYRIILQSHISIIVYALDDTKGWNFIPLSINELFIGMVGETLVCVYIGLVYVCSSIHISSPSTLTYTRQLLSCDCTEVHYKSVSETWIVAMHMHIVFALILVFWSEMHQESEMHDHRRGEMKQKMHMRQE
jgi:hypothetical protein